MYLGRALRRSLRGVGPGWMITMPQLTPDFGHCFSKGDSKGIPRLGVVYG